MARCEFDGGYFWPREAVPPCASSRLRRTRTLDSKEHGSHQLTGGRCRLLGERCAKKRLGLADGEPEALERKQREALLCWRTASLGLHRRRGRVGSGGRIAFHQRPRRFPNGDQKFPEPHGSGYGLERVPHERGDGNASLSIPDALITTLEQHGSAILIAR